MEKEIIKSYFKYQKTWPEPICVHQRKHRSDLPNFYPELKRIQPLATKDACHRDHSNIHDAIGTKPRARRSAGSKKRFQDSVWNRQIPGKSTASSKPSHLTKQSKIGCELPTTSDRTAAKSVNTASVLGDRKLKEDIAHNYRAEQNSELETPSTILRTYETRANYGALYQLRTLGKQTHSEYTDHGDKHRQHKDHREKNWFWPKDYRLWRKHFKQPILADVSSSEDDHESASKLSAKPHPDLYGVFNSVDLHRQLEEKGATDIQRLVRGWLVRRQLIHLQNKASELCQSWSDGMKEYLQVRSKVRARLHVMRNDPELDLHDVKTFLEQKKEYEDIFKRLATLSDDGRSLPARELREFFNACALNPSEREINEAFTAVFGGSTEIEVSILLDRSTECGPLAIKCHVGVAQHIVTSLKRLSAISRVSLVTFDETADHAIQMSSEDKDEGDLDWIVKTFDNIKLGNGPRNVHVGLEQLRNTFKSSSPGACKIGIAIVGGMSANPENTQTESGLIKQDHINLFAIGLGQIGTSQDICPPGNSYIAAGVGAWKRMSADVLEEMISKSTFANQREIVRYTDESCRPLTKEEVLAILWTIYPPQGVAARHHRRSTWLHPIIDNEEASHALGIESVKPADMLKIPDESMKKEAELLPCVRLVVEARIARDGFIVLPTDGPAGSERVHDLETAVKTFEAYIQSGKLSHLLT